MKGSALELLVKKSADRQASAGIWLARVSPRFAGRVEADGRAAGRLVGTGLTDLVGHIRGRALYLECKSTEHNRLDLALIRQHQAVLIERAHQAGALAGIVAELGARSAAPAYYLIPPELLARYWRPYWAEQAGYGQPAPGSISRAVLDAEAIQIRRDRHGLDLVSAVEALARLMGATA